MKDTFDPDVLAVLDCEDVDAALTVTHTPAPTHTRVRRALSIEGLSRGIIYRGDEMLPGRIFHATVCRWTGSSV